MFWMVYSAIAVILVALSNIIDKYIMSKWIKNPFNSVIMLGIVQILVAVVIFSIKGFGGISKDNILLALVAGIFYMTTVIFYFKAMQAEEVSSVVPLFSLNSILVLILATFFLDEILTISRYIGIFALFIGGVIISYNPGKIKPGRAIIFILLGTLALSITNVMLKYLLRSSEFWSVYAYVRIGILFVLIPIIVHTYNDFKQMVKENGIKVVGFIAISESLAVSSIILVLIAMSIGPVILTTAFVSTQNFVVLILTLVIGMFFPKFINEKFTRDKFIRKLVAIAFMFLGVYLIA